jgi:hypothetical protein
MYSTTFLRFRKEVFLYIISYRKLFFVKRGKEDLIFQLLLGIIEIRVILSIRTACKEYFNENRYSELSYGQEYLFFMVIFIFFIKLINICTATNDSTENGDYISNNINYKKHVHNIALLSTRFRQFNRYSNPLDFSDVILS